MLLFFRYLNLLSVDATLIALVWQEVIAHTGNMEPRWYERAVLGISVWIIYNVDHLLDTLVLKKSIILPSRTHHPVSIIVNQAPRHCFTAKHRLLFIFLVGIFLLVDISLALKLTQHLLFAGIALSVAVIFYLGINTWLLTHTRWPCGREIVITLIFSLGTGLVPLLQSQEPALIVKSLFLFALLCLINTTVVARLEQGVPYESLLAPLNGKKTGWLAAMIIFLLALGFIDHRVLIIKALFISLLGLLLIPTIAKNWGNETASLATDAALLLGAVFSL
ncbi:MAG: hypothetical protein ACH346_04200 [Chthoniobacterales bacterium]